MICEICNENEVAWTLIPIGEGLPQSLCDSCLAIRGIVWSKEHLPAEDIAAMLGPMFVRPPSPGEVANENPPAKPRTRKRKVQEVQEEGPPVGSSETPASGTDG